MTTTNARSYRPGHSWLNPLLAAGGAALLERGGPLAQMGPLDAHLLTAVACFGAALGNVIRRAIVTRRGQGPAVRGLVADLGVLAAGVAAGWILQAAQPSLLPALGLS